MNKPYETKHFDIYDKTLLIQRLLFAISQNCKEELMNREAIDLHKLIMKDAEKNADNLIDTLNTALEVIGFFPCVREVSSSSPQLWRQPTRVTAKKGETKEEKQ